MCNVITFRPRERIGFAMVSWPLVPLPPLWLGFGRQDSSGSPHSHIKRSTQGREYNAKAPKHRCHSQRKTKLVPVIVPLVPVRETAPPDGPFSAGRPCCRYPTMRLHEESDQHFGLVLPFSTRMSLPLVCFGTLHKHHEQRSDSPKTCASRLIVPVPVP